VTNPSMHVVIERLVIETGDGLELERRDGPAVERAVAEELGRLLAGGGLRADLASGGASPSVRGGTVEREPGGAPDALGNGIAGAVYEGIGR